MEISERMTQMIFSNGDVYFGYFNGTLPHGKGKYIWSDGKVYEGDWEEGKMSGEGHILFSSGATYTGNLCDGYFHGFGTLTGHDESVYTGSWIWNVQHGIGRKQYSNNDVYDGSWKEGVLEGSGRYAWSNGNTYNGKWKGGKMCGRGVMKWFNGDFFDGFWLNGFRHGSGFYSFADGCYYFGTWTKGLKDGQGIFYPSGSKCPSITKWFSFDGDVDKRSLFEKISKNALLRGPGRTSHRFLLREDRNPGDAARDASSHETSMMLSYRTSEEVGGLPHNITGVFEREYMQGVLIKERIRNKSGLTKNKLHGKFLANDVNKRSFLGIIERHKSYYLMLNLQLGIRYTVGKITPVPMREVRYSDFEQRARINMYFPRMGSQLTPPHYSIDFHWKDYCPMVFRNLRELFMLDAADYMMSICGDDGLREISSPGKSGSIFYLSHDDRFVIKTLRKSELKVLLKMLPSYYDHVKDHENTLITKFFGVHRITWTSGKQVRFVVMGNMFYTELRIHRRYDLKGSYQGRFTNKDEIDENTTLKDLDLSYEFAMDKSLRESLFKQISLDCLFLESQDILDYSLLLGLHFRAPEHLKALVDPPDLGAPENSTDGFGAISQGDPLISGDGLVLVPHEPSSFNSARGAHIRGNNLKAFSRGDEEVDLLLPGTGRLRVQLGVNMPAKANHKRVEDVADSTEVELFEVYDVVLYLGMIDILQDYNIKKKLEHAYKSLQYDPMSISAVEPNLYSKRFIAFLEKVFLVKS